MRLLPYQNFKIRTYLTPDQVHQELKGSIRPNHPSFSFGSSDKPYYGKITENHFKIYRINSILPSTEGKIQLDGGGSVIDLTIQSDMRIVGLVMLISFIVFGCTLSDIGAVFTNFVTHPGSATLFSIFNRIVWLSFILVLAYGMMQFSYLHEAAKVKSFIGKLVEKTDSY